MENDKKGKNNEHTLKTENKCGNWNMQGKQDMTFTPIDCLSYTFYLPLFMLGPVMTYNDFHKQVSWSTHQII